MWLQNLQVVMLMLLMGVTSNSQSVLGKWRAIHDETGKAVSIIEIYEKHGKVYGKVVEIMNPKSRNKVCSNCEGADKNKPLIGLTVIKGLTKDGDEYNGGRILDPEHGRLYRCYINLEEDGRLKVRGYVGISLFGRTQYWQRAQ